MRELIGAGELIAPMHNVVVANPANAIHHTRVVDATTQPIPNWSGYETTLRLAVSADETL